MISLFFKIFIAGVSFLILLLVLNRSFFFLNPFWQTAKRKNQLKPFLTNGMYSNPTVLRAVKSYLPPKCQTSLPKFTIPQKDLTQFVVQFIEHNTESKNLIILAIPGMGKTSFALNFYTYTKNQSSKKKYSTLLVPLAFKNADQTIKNTPDKENTVLFLDGLDEDIHAFSNPGERLFQLMETAAEYKKIIITSSLDFIPENQIKTFQKGYKTDSNRLKTSIKHYKTTVVYLPPMSYSRAEKILGHLLPFWKNNIKTKTLNYIQSNSAGVTPFTLNYLPQILPSEPMLLSKNYIYRQIVQHWINDQHAWPDKNILNHFIEQLAVDLFSNRFARGEESIHTDELITWFTAWGASLKPISKDSQTLISTDAAGVVCFTHRSIMEYLFVQQLKGANKHCHQTFLTDEMKSFFIESLVEQVSDSLSEALIWLKPFALKAQGLSLKSDDQNAELRPPLFQTILKKNPQFGFLNRLSRLLQNPVFMEFGWDPKLYKNLKLARHHSKSSFMELKDKRQNVLIVSEQIEISQKGKKTKRIKLTQNVFDEYATLLDSAAFIKLNRAVGLDGLQMIARLNRSGKLALIPDLKTFNSFTLFFWKNIFDTGN